MLLSSPPLDVLRARPLQYSIISHAACDANAECIFRSNRNISTRRVLDGSLFTASYHRKPIAVNLNGRLRFTDVLHGVPNSAGPSLLRGFNFLFCFFYFQLLRNDRIQIFRRMEKDACL